jgi:hypothetical protein
MTARSSLFLSFNITLTLQGSVPATQKAVINSIFHDSAQYEKSNGVGCPGCEPFSADESKKLQIRPSEWVEAAFGASACNPSAKVI